VSDDGIRGNSHVVVGLLPLSGESETAFVLAKQTFGFDSGRAQPAAPLPLLHDIRDPDSSPRLPTGSDFWLGKAAVDVVVQGSAFATGGTPTHQMAVSLRVDRAEKSAMVTGDRVAQFDDRGTCVFSRPEPFTEMPVTWANAYGGIDRSVPVDPDDPKRYLVEEGADHPGVYPRNPFGKGYVASPRRNIAVPLPNIEHPKDLLTPRRLLCADPRDWWKQPLSWGLDWVHPMMFPRFCFMFPDTDAWYPGPEDEAMPEVALGHLRRGYRSEMSGRPKMEGPHPWFLQEASHGLVFQALTPGLPIRVTGMHPKLRDVKMELPPAPRIHGVHERGTADLENLRVTNVVIHPNDATMSVTWAGTFPLPRIFIPGVHKRIPVAAKLEGFDPVAYPTPPTVKETLAAAQQRAES
jgi:hypothetical protein